jgi:glycosyltransferase involved in cell wall biosynthesis
MMPLRATAVIVLYRMAPEESLTFRSLLQARAQASSEADVSIVLWDNSPSPHFEQHLPENVLYFHDPSNPGLAIAYNRALEIALRQKSHWLITLDQDTVLPGGYVALMASAAHLCAGHPEVGAVVPQIVVGTKRHSPNYFLWGAIPRWHATGFRGIPMQPVFAFNSGAMIRVDAVRQIGGYDQRFPLDHSDNVMFRNLHQHGKRVYIEGRIQLQHDFALADMDRRMSTSRYRALLLAELAFWALYMNWLAGCERTLRLALRMIRHWQRGHRAELRHITWEFLLLRLFRSKKTQLRTWRGSLEQKRPPTQVKDAQSRPKVSVCMAACNGSRFIEAQLQSILPQLAPDDEVVIVDDASEDSTIACIESIRDNRIHLFAHEKNQGVVATFEDALRFATGQVLFLCDDDDLWAPAKVERVLSEFAAHPDARIVITRAALVDENGVRIPDARVNRYGKFIAGFWRNIFINHYQGSAMAIRASLLGAVLPFPRRKAFLHDVWIGTRNEALGGKTLFIDEPLLYYRRHSRNASRRHHPIKQIRIRIQLLVAHIAHAFSMRTLPMH